MRSVLAVGSVMLVASFPVAAQCPSGFLDAGEGSAVAAPGKYQEVEVTRELALPLDIQIDDSYHQKSIQAASDGAASDMRAAQIPAGIRLIPGGLGGGGWWSIDNPELKRTSEGDRDVRRWIFRIDLYVNTGGRTRPAMPLNSPQPMANVCVRVCVKPHR